MEPGAVVSCPGSDGGDPAGTLGIEPPAAGGTPDAPPEQLSEAEARRLAQLEDTVQQNLKGFKEAGSALALIRDERLYRSTHSSFESYVLERWGLKKSHAYRLIQAFAVAEEVDVGELSPIRDGRGAGTPALSNEGQARELARAPAGQRRQILQAAVDEAPKDAAGNPVLTASHLRRKVDERAAARNPGTSTTDDHRDGSPPGPPDLEPDSQDGSSGNPFDPFNVGVEEVIALLRQAYAKFAKLTGYTGDKGGRQFKTKWAQSYSPAGTLGVITKLSLVLKQGKPAELWERHPGYRTVYQVKAMDRLKKN